MNACGFWAHCAYHCDLSCDHDEWCPGFPVTPAHKSSRAAAWLRRLATRLERHA